MSILVLFSASLTFTLGILSFIKKQRTKSNIWLGLWMWLTTAEILIFYVDRSGLYYQYPFALGLKSIFPFIHPVLLYLYVRSLTGKRITGKMIIFHFVPLLAFLLNISPLLFASYEEKLEIIKKAEQALSGSLLEYLPFVIFIYVGTYLIVAYQILVKRIGGAVRNILWVKRLTLAYLIFWVVLAALSFVSYVFYPSQFNLLSTLNLFVFSTFLILVGLDGLSHTSLLSKATDSLEERFPIVKLIRTKYLRSGLNDQQATDYYTSLIEHLETRKTFMNNRLSLKKLAEELHISENHLSQAINMNYKGNFYDLINSYRVDEFKKRLANHQHKKKTLHRVARECGFTSRSSFNAACKKFTGKTPSQLLSFEEKNAAISPN